jgi:hypothetical protein
MTIADWAEWAGRDVRKPNWPDKELPHRDHPLIREVARRQRRTVEKALDEEISRYHKDIGGMAWAAAGWVHTVHTALKEAQDFSHFKQLLGV